MKFDLADALDKSGNPQEACAVLTALPPGADVAIESVRRFYGIRDSPEVPDLLAETARVAKLVHDASVRFDDLQFAVQRAESPAEKARLIEEYLGDIDVPHFKQRAEELLRRA